MHIMQAHVFGKVGASKSTHCNNRKNPDELNGWINVFRRELLFYFNLFKLWTVASDQL